MAKEKLIKSKERVRNHGEVFTPEWVVKAMCDLLEKEHCGEDMYEIEKTFLEPACGTGNFLVEIFARKLNHCKDTTDAIKALNSIFAIELLQDNVDEARARLLTMFKDAYPNADGFEIQLAQTILENNVIQGNTLELQDWLINEKWFTVI
ncbi:MAG: SAM-dependent methyltransferase [Clostridia bacterium]|nr:SAM-dependent methyltransferase [Clostridia bacterium]